ncbi:LysR family transcriptional regulator [Corticibacter populi]|uniref:LysR family transcriptional regulator n=1 Tax=Corticibacter populi TaxID=1550736 RepID=A0A3M6QPI2_9BURK|nr:LysR family transcriptional regulator [Corticibacter populi]RMX04948.1 LysR family transcriptional regulator [Corticibacter populi]RZS33626.1 LysR family transcriptional regulator [Corticibacter populi]
MFTSSSNSALARRLAARLRMKHLLLLQAIGEHGSLTRVAQHMATSQPAVTQALADLEELFGAPLFIRSARGMAPTPLGELVLARASAMLTDLDHWAQDCAAAGTGRAAHLHVGVIPFLPGRLLAAAIARTRPQGKRITVSLHEGTSDHLLERLRAHELDCVVGRTSAILDMHGLRHEVLYEQVPRLIAHRRLAARLSRRPLAWQELAELDWILGARQTPMREQVTDFFLRAGVPPPAPIVESLSAKLIGELIAANERAISIVPADIADELARIAGVDIVQHHFGWTLPPITLFERTSGAQSAEQALFAQALRQACAALMASSRQVGGEPADLQ